MVGIKKRGGEMRESVVSKETKIAMVVSLVIAIAIVAVVFFKINYS